MSREAKARAPCLHARRAASAACLALLLVSTADLRGAGRGGSTGTPGPTIDPVIIDSAVEPVTGASWIEQKYLSFGETSLGREGRSGPARPTPASSPGPAPDPPAPGLFLTGSDLYRVSCSSCHGASGAGAPPEIRAVFGPAQATSAAYLLDRLRARGLSMDPAAARRMAAQSEQTIRDRLRDGGERMPSFRHLHAAEVDALLDYLRELGGVRERHGRPVVESVFRVGENVVRGTCQTCHAATGPGPRDVSALPQASEHHVRPSLAGIARELSLEQFEAKVREGVAVHPSEERGVMPVFDYLRPEEVRAAFLYLVAYPPAPTPVALSRR